MIQEATEITVALCRRFEGFYHKPYLCPAGVPTIGYGATRYADGRIVHLTDQQISREAAERLLFLTISRDYMPAVLRLCPSIGSATKLAALTDFTFNLGAGNLRQSTLRKRVNAGDWESVPGELMRWTKGGGRVLPGLVKRRAAESQLVTA